ncbi:Adhesin yadA precursor [Glaesserella parasuis]|uniref:YadA-like family protein n=1 Tax=Glaesserella parasuis TaxID=738 RepID=UPI0004DCD1A9|nr:YadA-like family protein [Glaesserella parasuis]KEZ22976.1 Adhesin yadA precursor [Glaesserella parasuis]
MNKIFKVIFNKTTGQFVVVSELSKAKGKASSSTDERIGVSSLVTKLQYQAKAALILGLLGVSSVAYAAEPTYGDSSGTGNSIAIGNGSNASGEANIALGELSSATDISKAKKQMIAIGGKASVTGSQAIAIGGDTAASGFGSIAIGGDDADGLTEYKELRYNPTSGKVETRKSNESAYQKTTASGVGSISIGPKSQSLQNGTVAVGVLATAAGTESVSIGVKSASKGESSVALGAGSTASANNSVAIGNKAVAESDGGVALGKDSIANIAAGSKGYDVSTNAETTETNSTWKATHAAVSVGKADGTVTRQIKGVAAGSNDTDAVNVAQLKKVTLKVAGNSGSGSVALNSQTLNIEGQDGIVSQATGQKVIVKLDSTTKGKVDSIGTGEVAASNANTVTGGKVYTAIAGAKTTVSAAAGQDVITVTPTTSSTGITANSYTVGINTTKLADAVKTNTKGDITSSDLTITNGTDRLLGTDNVIISLKDADKQAIAKVAEKLDTATYNADKLNFADKNLSNLTNAGNTVIKNQAKQAINVVGANSRVTVNKDTTVASGVDTYKVSVDVSDLATKTEVGAKLDSSAFTNENVTSKVNTGSLTSTTLTVDGAGKVVGGNLTVNLKNGAIDTAHLSTAVQNSITNAKTKVEVNPASGGILKLDTSTDTTQPTTYTLSIDEAKLKEKAGTTNLATEYAKADASNIDNHISEWKTKLGVSDLTATNLSYKGNETSATTKTTSLATGLTFASSDLDIAATDGGNLSFTLKNQAVSKDNLESTVANKIDLIGAGTVASNSAGTVTGGAVHTAITGAKTKVALATDSASALTLEKTETADLNANTYTLKLNAEQLKQDLGVQNLDLNYQGNSTGGTKQKTTLSDGLKFTSDDLTITAKTGGEINLALKADTLNNTAKLKYKANGDATAKETALSTGLNFNSASTDALTIGTEADGKVNFTINTGAFADTGLAAKNGDSNKLATVGGVATAISSVNTALTTLINNKASKSLNDITAEGKNVIKGLIDVKKADGDNNLVTVTSTNVGEVEIHTISVTKDAVKTALNGDFAAKDASNLVEADVNKWKNKLGVANLNLKYKGNDSSAAKETTLSTGLAFNSDDLTITTGDSGNLTLTLKNGAVSKANLETEVANKIDRIGTGNVADNNTGTVTGDTVYKAINEAKNSLTSGGMTFAGNSGTNAKVPLAGTLSIKGEGTVQGGFASNNITVVSDDTSKTLTVKLAENLSNIKNIELKGTAGKDGKIGVDADGNVTVINGINGTNGSATPSKVVTEATIGTQTIKYTANSNADKKSVSLSSGFNFLNGTNTTATVGENGQVTYNLNPELTGITSIGGANGSGKLSFDVNKQINVNGGTITNLASGLTGGKVTDSNQNHVATLGDLKTLSAWEILGNGTAAKTAAGAANTQAKTLVDQTRNRVDFSGGGAAVVTVKEKESNGYQVEVNVKQGSVTLPTTGTPTTLDDLKVDAGNEGVATVTTVVNTVKKTAEILTGKGLNFEGETTGDAVARKLGETLKLQGGATGDLSSNNIAVKKNNSNDGYDIKLAQALTGLKSATFGEANDQTVINKDGLTVKGANDSTLVSLTDKTGTPTLEFAKNGAAGTGVITGLKDLTDNADGSSATNKNYVDTKLSALTNTGFVVGSDKAKNGAAVTSLSETHALGKQLDIVGASSEFTGEVAGSEVTASAGNIVTKVEKDGDKTKVQIGLNKNLKLEQVTFGSDPEQTTIGKDGVTVKGANTETKITDSGVAVTGKNGVNGKNGVEIKSDDSGNGSIVINGKDGQNSSQATISVSPAKDATTTDPSTKGLDNNIDSRIQYQDGNTTHQLATLDDGLVFQGNDGQAVTRKLNTTLTIKGTVDSVTDTLSDGKNIGVVKDASAGANGLVVKLAKNLTALDSATFGSGDNSAVLDADSLTFKAKGEAADATVKTLTISNDKTKGGSITGLEVRNVESENYGTGNNETRAATESAVKEVSDRVNKAADGTTGVVVYTDQDGKRIVKDNGQFYLTKADGTADKTKPTVPADKVLVSIVNPDNLSDKQAVGNANKLANLAKGTVSTTSTEAITGAQLHDLVTHVGLTPNDTKTGFNALSFDAITASVASGSAVARTDLVNAVKDIIIAVNKGTVTQGDNNSSVTRQLGQTLKLNGGATGTLSDNNIGVVVNDQTNVDGFNIKLAKDLKNLASAEFVGTGDNAEKTTLSSTGMKVETVDGNNKAEATYGKDGLTVKGADGNNAISLTNKTDANNTTTPALEFAKGADGKGTGAISGLKDIDPSDTDGSKATNKNYVDDKFNSLKEAGIKVGADQGDVKTHKLGNQLDIKAGAITTGSGDTEVKYSGDNLITKVSQDTTSGKTTVEIGLKEKLALKELTVDDTAEKGKVKLAEDAVTVVNKDSKDAVSVTTDAEGDGKVVVNNKAGESAVEVGHNEKGGLIKLTGVKAAGTAAPTAEISVVGNKTADSNQGLDTTNKIESRISYNDGNTEHKLATLDDGLTFSGDDDQDVTRKLGTELTIKGGKSTGLTENNIGVVKATSADGLVVKLAEELTALKSAKFGTDGNGATITSEGTEIVATAADGTKASATYALEGMKLVDGNNTSTTTASGSTVTNGTTTTDTTAEGVKVSSNDKDDKSEATYGKDGLTVKGADGKDAINLTNKAGANNTATPTLEFAKGTDGKGTGAISGLQDIDPLDTDGSKATNKNYVDSRIADLDAGKPFEYFDNQGNKVVRGKDNQFYKATDIDGKVYVEGKGYVLPADKDNQNAKGVEAVKSGDVVIKAMPNSDQPMGLSNIRSGLGLSPITETKDNQTVETAITKEAAQKAVDSLVTQTGSGLNNAATVRDLQALAQAGVDFTGNNAAENKDVHRPLGTKLTIEGEATTANQTKAQFGETAADNIHVEAKGAENKLVVSLSKDLKNLKTVTASDSIQVGTDANGVKITPDATTTTKTEGTGADKKVTTVTAGAEGTSIVQKDANDQPLKSAEYKLDGSKVDDGKGNTTEVKAGGLTAKDADSTTKVDANGMDVKSDDPNDKSAATYGKDGLTVKGNDGKDAISLTSTTAGGKTTNTLALNGKDGKDAVSITSGADGAAPEISFAKNGEDGTGSITGLKDVERNPDGTAKDKTQAANAGYVDDRLKEMNEGKPFEYFEKDPVTGEVKTETVNGEQVPVTLVRGKDGKFYKESDLKGKVFDPATNTYKNADGTPATLTEVASNNVTVQAMPSPTGKPLEMGNVGSGLGLDDSTTTNATALTPEQAQTAIAGSGKDGKGGLLTKTGSSLNNVATVKDLQALAQAGLDFVGNETTTTAVHRPLGTKLVVQGETDAVNQTLTQFGATAKDNIYVDTDATNNKLVVKMTEDLKNINSLTTKPVDNPDGTKTSTKLTSTGTVVSKVDPAKLDANGKPTPVETANYGLTTELKKTDADGKVTTSTSAPTGTTLSEVDKDGNKLREAEYDLDGTKVTLKDPVTGATKEISTGVDGTKVTSKDPATGVTKETTIGVDGTTVKVTDKNNPNNNKSAEYGVDGTALKAKDAQGNDISADYKVGGATVKDKDNTTEIKPDGMTVKSTDEADKSEAKYGKDGLSIVGPKGKDGKDGISLGYKPDTDANGQLTGTSTPTLEFGKGEKDPDGNDKGTGSITGLKDIERNKDGSAKDKTAAVSAGYVDERLAEANATKPLEYFGTDGKKLVLGQDGKFYKPEDLEGKVYVKRKDGTEGYFNREEKDNPTAKPVDLKNKAVDPQTVTIKAMPSDASNTPIAMSNVGSGLGLEDDAESNKTALTPTDAQKAIAGDNKDGKGGLLAQTGNALNNVATVKDLQAIAQAGLDFTGNNTATTVHRPLGTKLTVEGEGKWNGKDSAANNLYVEAQEADNKLVVKMNKDLTNLNSVTLGTATMTGKDNTINLTGAGAQVVEEFVKWDPVTKQPIRDKDGNLQKYTEKVDPRVKLSGIADGDISPNSTDAVNGRQVYALTNGNQVEQKKDGSTATYAKNKDGSVITEVKRDKSGNPVVDADGKEIVQPKEYKLTTYNVSEQQEFVTNSVITAVHNMNEQGIKFFHTNDGHNAEEQINQQSNTVDSSASGTYATAVGYKAVAAGDNALAMGKGATASGKNSIAIGTGNQVIANKSGAFGDPNIIRGVQIGTDSAGNPIYKGIDGSYAFGNDNVITSSNTFVLGNNVNNKRDSNGALTWMSAIPEGTVENSVYLGNNTTATAGDGSQTGSLKNWKQDGSRGSTTTAGSTGTVSSATVGNMIYGGFAGATANGVVSVGAAGDERRIQNVAAGEISSTSTDAINGSQLYNVAHRLGAKLESEGRQLRAGIAATTAMSNIPQVTLPGKSTLGAGIGTFEGQNAIAVGFSRMSDNGRVILKVSAGATSQGKYNAGAGIALQW